jgi:hypothetical protein
VLVDRQSFLIEETPEAFAAEHRFRLVTDENLALNPAIAFRVERFEPAEGFQPTKPYASRISWRDKDGNDQSKLLLSEPEQVLTVIMASESRSPASRPAKRRSRKRSAASQPEA